MAGNVQDLTGMDLTLCPQCGKGRLIRFQLSGSKLHYHLPYGIPHELTAAIANPTPFNPQRAMAEQ